ncbi:Fe-S cluster assembly protein SufD [Bradyrhizobium algeriense]|uniref:Fe-S cluster assembly protein SufD n=1 Tax=Bradyrhizobium algeriense TaxID=634784 RepID=UPI000D3B1AA1|nr:Fe-S cluster assembly protein SufD [Bradyrhizobium algeriense]
MNLALAKNETGRALSDSFAIARDRLPGTGSVAEARSAAFEAYDRVGLPHRRIEDWKYTDLRALMREVLPLAPAPDAAALARAAAAVKVKPQTIKGVRRLVLVDGVFAPKLSELAGLEKGLAVRTLRDVLEAGEAALQAQLFTPDNANPMVALNSAMMTDGVVIEIGNGVVLTQPLHVIHIASGSAPAAMFTRSLLRLGKDAGATLVESYIAADGATAYQVHDSLIVTIGDNSRLDQIRLIEDGREAVNISSAVITLGAHAHFNTFGMTSGAAVSRYQATITFAGEHSRVETNGVNLLNGRQHADTTLFMDHAVPHCASREVFRAVADDRGHSVFQGRIIVRPDAQKTDAKMMTRALLLSDEAEADNKPELEIFADDVTCGHGATTGALDESLLFYLRARGLSEKEAQALLIQAFVGEAIESIVNDDLRELAIAAAQRWLEARG